MNPLPPEPKSQRAYYIQPQQQHQHSTTTTALRLFNPNNLAEPVSETIGHINPHHNYHSIQPQSD